VQELVTTMNGNASPDTPMDATASLAMSLRRIMRTIRTEEDQP